MRMTKTCLILVIGIAAGLLVLATAPGQGGPKAPATTRVAVCDVGEVFEHCVQSNDLIGELRKRRLVLKAEDEKRAKAVNELALELRELKLGSKQYESRLVELDKMQISHKGWRDLQELQLRRWHLQKTKELYKKIVDAVSRVAKRQGFQIVLYRTHGGLKGGDLAQIQSQMALRKVIYNDPNLDLTAMVLSHLNEAFRARRP